MQDNEKNTKKLKSATCKAGLQLNQCKADLQGGTCKADLQLNQCKADLQGGTCKAGTCKADLHQLRWVRVFTPFHIPKYLVEQIKSREYSVDQFYKNQEKACTYIDEDGNQAISPINHLYVLSDDDYKVVGFLWFVIDDLSQAIVVQHFSIDRKFWSKGGAIDLAAKHVKEILKNAKLKKVYWVTNRPKVFEKAGFIRAKDTIMQWDPEGENHGEIVNGGKQNQRNPKQSNA